jgi:hypothetical protein
LLASTATSGATLSNSIWPVLLLSWSTPLMPSVATTTAYVMYWINALANYSKSPNNGKG